MSMPSASAAPFREMYARACGPEPRDVAGPRELTGIRPQLAGLGLDVLADRARAFAAAELAACRELLSGPAREVLARRALLACAPLGLMSGAWLQWLTCPGNADDETAMRLLTLYAADVGAGQPDASRGAAYLALLRGQGLARYAVPAGRLALDRRVADWCFELPAVLLAMSRQPEEFAPEIAGADLCLRTVGPLPPLAALDDVAGTALDPGSARHGARPGIELSSDVADALAAAGQSERVTSGFAWALGLLADFAARLRADLASARDPSYEMAELLRARSREACAYHQDYQLDGRPLADWLREARADPAGLLTALAGSKLIRPGRPAASPLLGSLISARGPMFRVFAPEDLAVIRRWIASLPRGHKPAGPAAGT
ncbi:MAG TPA: iron-containing redox enzyme family protein, partial [Streptosporangiaceae bacterium]